MIARLPLACVNCGKDLTEAERGREWADYYGLMVACAGCLWKEADRALARAVVQNHKLKRAAREALRTISPDHPVAEQLRDALGYA